MKERLGAPGQGICLIRIRMVVRMTFREIGLLRLSNQQILDPHFSKPGMVVTALGALQAQDYAGALWSVGLRMPVATVAGIRKALADREIVRTWLLRGTLHFVAPDDVRWILGLVAPRVIAGSAGRHRRLGLEEKDFVRSRELFTEELQGGRQLTREEIFRLLREAGISPDGQRGYHLLWRAGMEGLICFGNHRGTQPTFVLLDEWVSPGHAFGREKAVIELAKRYFTGHGPATLQDFVWWSGLKVSEVKAGIEAAGPAILGKTINGIEFFMAQETMDPPGDEPEAYLLPGFDEYILGYHDRRAVLNPSLAGRTVIGGNGMMLSTIVVEGSVAGTWKRGLRNREIVVALNPFSSLTSAHQRLVNSAAERYGRFIGMPVVVEW